MSLLVPVERIIVEIAMHTFMISLPLRKCFIMVSARILKGSSDHHVIPSSVARDTQNNIFV